MNTTGRPRMLAVSAMVSRVVPGMAETMARSWPRSWLSRLDLPALGRPMIAARMPRRRICPSWAVRSNSSMKATPCSSRAMSWSRVSGAMSSSGKSMCASTWARVSSISSRSLLMRWESLPASCSLAARKASSVREWIKSATASACARSMRPLRKARRVNSPGSASRAPFASTVSRTIFAARIPPWQVISTTSSRVKVRGARMTASRASSTVCPSRTTWPKWIVCVAAADGLTDALADGRKAAVGDGQRLRARKGG